MQTSQLMPVVCGSGGNHNLLFPFTGGLFYYILFPYIFSSLFHKCANLIPCLLRVTDVIIITSSKQTQTQRHRDREMNIMLGWSPIG